jgi:hypothetical protein
MADVPGIGAFIPNKDGYPKILTMTPAERAQYLAAKEAEKTPAQQQETQQAVEPVSTAESGGGIDVQV